jgi:hypothetical protein
MALTTTGANAVDHGNPTSEPNVAQHGHVAAKMTPKKAAKTPSKSRGK